MSGLVIEKITKKFRVRENEVTALGDFSLSITPGEFLSIIGTSGCGKTTLLRIILGLDKDFDGSIILGGRKVSGPGVDRGIVFQEPRLFPWLNVEQNIGVGLIAVGLPAIKKKQIVAEHVKLVGLGGFEGAYPHQLSGGMAQRVAIARALVSRPQILLLDEPFGSLDALTRLTMQEELARIWQAEAITTIMVTHDIEEAVYLSNRVVLMSCRPGRVEEIVDVRLPHPRDRANYEFLRLSSDVLTRFKAGKRSLEGRKALPGR